MSLDSSAVNLTMGLIQRGKRKELQPDLLWQQAHRIPSAAFELDISRESGKKGRMADLLINPCGLYQKIISTFRCSVPA